MYAVTVDQVDAARGPFAPLGTGRHEHRGATPRSEEAEGFSVETFLLDFDGDLYDTRLRLHFVARLREEKRFGSLDELKAQIARDIADARAALAAP